MMHAHQQAPVTGTVRELIERAALQVGIAGSTNPRTDVGTRQRHRVEALRTLVQIEDAVVAEREAWQGEALMWRARAEAHWHRRHTPAWRRTLRTALWTLILGSALVVTYELGRRAMRTDFRACVAAASEEQARDICAPWMEGRS